MRKRGVYLSKEHTIKIIHMSFLLQICFHLNSKGCSVTLNLLEISLNNIYIVSYL